MFKLLHYMLAVILAASLLLPYHASAQTELSPQFTVTDCPLELPEGVEEGIDVICGYVEAPAQHADLNGPTIQIAVVVIPSTTATPHPDPLVMAQGGPGGSTLDAYISLAGSDKQAFRDAINRDIVLIEQRGTHYSQPFLFCESAYQTTLNGLGSILPKDEEIQQQLAVIADCQDQWAMEGIDLNWFDSLENAADFTWIMDALGYNQFNYYGVSYGTMLGQHLLRDYPDRLRSVILDAVVPLSENFIPNVAFSGERAIDLLFEQCRQDEFCNTNYPDIETVFYALVSTLNNEPASLTLINEADGASYDYLLNGDRLIEYTFQLLYSAELLPLLPGTIQAASQGNYMILEIFLSLVTFDTSQADGMYMGVMCAEEKPLNLAEGFFDSVDPAILQALGDGREFNPLCESLALAPLGDEANQAVISSIPTLVLNGQLDPITPPQGGEQVASTLENSFNFTFPAMGHGAFDSHDCPTSIVVQFLDQPDVEPDSTCISELQINFDPSLMEF